MKHDKKFGIAVLAMLFMLTYMGSDVCAQPKSVKKPASRFEVKKYYPVSRNQAQLVEYVAFSLLYNEPAEQPYWVTYLLTAKMVETNTAERSDNFAEDHNIKTGSATPADYKKSGYDKGHLCPAADMNHSAQAMKECFLMSNMSPQVPDFNRGIWRLLEEQVRHWAMANDSLIVITGPIFKGKALEIGKNKVDVPFAYFKIVADIALPEIKVIAFVMENKDHSDSYFNYAVPVDSVEALTGLDFFATTPVLNKLESKVSTAAWKLAGKPN